jgi:hypothetical protein
LGKLTGFLTEIPMAILMERETDFEMDLQMVIH